jgi:hypothetical protein
LSPEDHQRLKDIPERDLPEKEYAEQQLDFAQDQVKHWQEELQRIKKSSQAEGR